MVRKMSMEAAQPKSVKHVPSYCYNCVSGPDLMKVKVVDGIATEIEPNFAAADVHPAKGRVCVKAYGLVQKTYNPNRISTPMKRTNPKKGRNEDPGFVPISWDEALDIVAEKLKAVRAKGLVDEAGCRASPSASAMVARRPITWAPSRPSSPPGATSISASAPGRASSACIRNTCMASSGIAASPSPPIRRTAATTSPSAPMSMSPAAPAP
jgi:anaerobic selenocysteine-containing dehydrogenase